ncbi:hypothetical protein AN452_10330 [Pseudomonas aeruginosa]|nr:hypothetical protein AN452_10330 [Pseudomonas aeruginosa]
MVVWIFEWLSRHFVRWMFRSGAFIKLVARVCRKRCGVIRTPTFSVNFRYMASTWSEFITLLL